MGILLVFVLSVVLCFFVYRKSYRKQLTSQPSKKIKATFVSAFLSIAVFIVVNTVAAVALIPEEAGSTATASSFDGMTIDKFKQLYNDNLEGIATSGKVTKTIAIKSIKRNNNTVDFLINPSIKGRAEVDQEGKIASVLWSTSNAKPDSLLSMAVAVEVLDATSERDEVLKFIQNAVSTGTSKSSFKTKRGDYYLSNKNGGQLSLLITPLY